MEFFGNKLCISARELVDGGIMTLPNYKQLSARGRIDVVRSARGFIRYALVAVDSLPTTYKEKVEEKYPGGNAVLLRGWIISNYELDQAAVAYFMDWAAQQHSSKASAELAKKYAVNASVLNTCIRLYNRSRDYRKLMGEKYDWGMMATVIETLREGVRPRSAGIDTPLPQKGGRIQARRLCLPDKRQVRQPEREEGGP